MYCRNCNKEIPDSTGFCPYCGTPQNAPMTPPSPVPSYETNDDNATVLVQDGFAGAPNPYGGYQPPVQGGYQQPAPGGYQQPGAPVGFDQNAQPGFQPAARPPQKKKTGLIIGIVAGVVGLFIIIGIIGMLVEKFVKYIERRFTGWQEKRDA